MSLSDIFDTSEKPKRKKKVIATKGEEAEAEAPPEPDELEEYRKKSTRAALSKPIQEEKLRQYKIEKEKMGLETAAGNIMQTEMGRFLFFGFFEKASRDWQRVSKRNKPILKNLVAEGDLDGVMDLYDGEIVAIIKGLKGEAKKQVAAWRRELKEGK